MSIYRQHSKFTGRAESPFIPWNADRDGPAPTVRFLQQTGEGRVIYADAAGDTQTVPSHEFFGAFRDAMPSESREFEGDEQDAAGPAGGSEAAGDARAAADDARAAADSAASAANKADDRARDAAQSATEGKTHAKAAGDSARAADDAAKKATAAPAK